MFVSKRVEDYQELVEQTKPRPRYLRNAVAAFSVGGSISLLGQLILNFAIEQFQMSADEARAVASVSLIVLSALLTSWGIYDGIGRFAGAGSAVPITGFANSVVSAGIDFSREGLILGLGAKLFIVAGPVLVYGSLTAFVMGLIRLLLMLLGVNRP